MTPASDEAARLAANLARNCNYAAFPCRDDKRPACPHGFKDAESDPAAIAELWRRHPGPLIGIATGSRSNLDVLDVDLKSDPARVWWRANQYRLPPTRTFRTRSGGIHCYHVHAPGVTCSRGVLPPGCDVRGDGGYIISWFAAGLDCLDHAPPAPWPAWLLASVLPKPRPPPSPRHARADPSDRDGRAIEGALRLIASAPQGERNSVLHWSACRLGERVRAGRIGAGEAETLLVAAATASGLVEREARATIRSGLGRSA